MTDSQKPLLASTDRALLQATQTGEDCIELTPDLLTSIRDGLAARTADIAERYPALVAACPDETRLAVAAWVFAAIVDHAREGGTYRYLIYERLGFGPEAYVPLYQAGGMTISNEFDLSPMDPRAVDVPEIAKAETIAILAHHGQTTQSEGMPFIQHPAAVAASVALEFKAAAWLHDVLEDSAFTAGHLRAAGIEEATIAAVEIVTRPPHELYGAFIVRIATSGNVAAITVKLADLRHNLRPGCPESLAARYRAAVPVLEAALAQLLEPTP